VKTEKSKARVPEKITFKKFLEVFKRDLKKAWQSTNVLESERSKLRREMLDFKKDSSIIQQQIDNLVASRIDSMRKTIIMCKTLEGSK